MTHNMTHSNNTAVNKALLNTQLKSASRSSSLTDNTDFAALYAVMFTSRVILSYINV